jgi:hypothetical protein
MLELLDLFHMFRVVPVLFWLIQRTGEMFRVVFPFFLLFHVLFHFARQW